MNPGPGMSPPGAPRLPRSLDVFLRIRPERISWLRFLLEGYDGLAVLTTLSAAEGLVRLRLLDCALVETMRLLAAVAGDLSRKNEASL